MSHGLAKVATVFVRVKKLARVCYSSRTEFGTVLQEFKTFVMRGNVLDLAIGVIIGAAFGKIVSSLTDDIIMPIIGFLIGGIDFSSLFIRIGPLPAGYTGSPTDYAALKKAGVAMIGYGNFITILIQFLILAWIIFLIVRAANRIAGPPPAAAEPAVPEDIKLLTEIRDELKAARA